MTTKSAPVAEEFTKATPAPKKVGTGNGDAEYSPPSVVLGNDIIKPPHFLGDDLQWGAACVMLYVMRYGIVPVKVLRKLFAKEAYDVAEATFVTMHRYMTRTHMTWRGRDFEAALRVAVKNASEKEIVNVPFAAAKRKEKKVAASTYAFRIRFITPCLGGLPGQETPMASGNGNGGDNGGEPVGLGANEIVEEVETPEEEQESKQRTTYVFHEKDDEGHPMLMERHWQAMACQALKLLGQEDWAIRKLDIRFANSTAINARMGTRRLSVIVVRKGIRKGVGVTEFEAMMPGTEIEGMLMASVDDILPDMLQTMLKVAGQFCGCSPSKAHRGYGRFELLWFKQL